MLQIALCPRTLCNGNCLVVFAVDAANLLIRVDFKPAVVIINCVFMLITVTPAGIRQHIFTHRHF